MEERIDVIENFIGDLKREALTNKTKITLTDETNIRDVITIEVKNLKGIEPKDYMRVLEVKLNAPGRNLFTAKGIDLDAIKFMAKETTEIVTENQKKQTVNVTEVNQDVVTRNEQTREEIAPKRNDDERFKATAEAFMADYYPSLSKSTQEEVLDEIAKARNLKLEIEKQKKLALSKGESFDTQKAIEENAAKFGLNTATAVLSVMSVFEVELSTRDFTNGEDVVKYIESDFIVSDLISEEIKKELSELKVDSTELEKNSPEAEGVRNDGDSENKNVPGKAESKAPKNKKFFMEARKIIMNPFTFSAIKSLEGLIKEYEEKIKTENKISRDGEYLASHIIQIERLKRDINKGKENLAAREGKGHPLLTDQIRGRVLQEFTKNKKNVTQIYETLVEEGIVNKVNGLSVYDLINVVKDEMFENGVPKDEVKAFGKSQTEIFETTVRLKAKQEICRNAKRKKLSATEILELKTEISHLASVIHKEEIKSLKNVTYLNGSESKYLHEEPEGQLELTEIQTDVRKQVGKDSFVWLLQEQNITQQDVGQEQHGIRKIVEYIKSKMPVKKSPKDNVIQEVTNPEIQNENSITQDISSNDESR